MMKDELQTALRFCSRKNGLGVIGCNIIISSLLYFIVPNKGVFSLTLKYVGCKMVRETQSNKKLGLNLVPLGPLGPPW